MGRRLHLVSKLSSAALACLALCPSAWAGPAMNLSSVQYVQYGDGQSYSLPFAVIDQCGGTKAGCQYYLPSAPGQIDNLVVLATGTENGPTTTNFLGMDNAYRTPDGAGGAPFFRPDASNSRGSQGAITGNLTNTWDASLSSLKSFLGSDQMVFFFNNNQTKSGGTATESLAAWARVWITDDQGANLGYYDFTNRGGRYALFTEGGGGTFMGDVGSYTSGGGGPLAGDNSATDYVLSGGAICRNNFGIPVSCSTTSNKPVDHNLGANETAYAILFPELNAQMNSLFSTVLDTDLAKYTFHADIRLGCDAATTPGNCTGDLKGGVPFGRDLNNGYEQIFMGRAAQLACTASTPGCSEVPEPASLWLTLGGLGAMGLLMPATLRRRSRATG
ncbi:hypothetical protein ACS5PK_08315 [Roseateles sp. DB2]|uniref:hypothetical protein n=1 Tax=Roseateles sp. DB2 TaxID=3453717 RepID=UPI003EEE2E42